MILLDILKYFGPPILAGIIGAYLGNFLSARYTFERFRKEQWWQSKREAYEAIIRSLTSTLLTAEEYIAAQEHRSIYSASPEASGATRDGQRFAWNLKEIAAAGSYIVSLKTVDAVQDVLRAFATEVAGEDPFLQAEREYDAADSALAIVRREAHCDLGIKSEL